MCDMNSMMKDVMNKSSPADQQVVDEQQLFYRRAQGRQFRGFEKGLLLFCGTEPGFGF